MDEPARLMPERAAGPGDDPARSDDSDEMPASWDVEFILASLPAATVKVGREIYRRLQEGAEGLSGADTRVADALKEILAKGAEEMVGAPLFIRQAAVEIIYERESAPFEAELLKRIAAGTLGLEEAEEARSVHRKIGGVDEINGEAARFIGYFERLAADRGGDASSEAEVYIAIARERMAEKASRLDDAPANSYVRELAGKEPPRSIEEAVLRFVGSEEADKYRGFVAKAGAACEPSQARDAPQGKGSAKDLIRVL